MRLSKEDYKKANDCLKRYNYNYIFGPILSWTEFCYYINKLKIN